MPKDKWRVAALLGLVLGIAATWRPGGAAEAEAGAESKKEAKADAAGKPDLVFIHMADPQFGFKDYDKELERFRRAIGQINAAAEADGSAFILISGDLVNTSDDKAYRDWFDAVAALRIPWRAMPGNHDIVASRQQTRERYLRLFEKTHYTFDHGDYRVIVVDTNLWKEKPTDETTAMDQWFENELARAAADGRIAMVAGHHPLFVAKADEKESWANLPPARRESLLKLFKEHGVIAYFGGHTHSRLALEWEGIRLLHPETTSVNLDKRPHGYRRVEVTGREVVDHFVPLAKEP